MTPFESCLAKFNRAEQQLNSLHNDLLLLSDLKSYTIIKEVDNTTGYHIYRFGEVPPIPEDLGLRVGELLYNFRCSLDHIIWEMVISSGNIATFRNEFPIFNDPTKYNVDKRSKLKGIPNTMVPIIDSLQPCNSTSENKMFLQYLWYLQRLCNADKHRYLLLTRRSLRKKLNIVWMGDKVPKARYFDAPVENGAIFLRIEPDVDVDVRPTIDILFSNAPSDIRIDLPVLNIAELIHGAVWHVLYTLHVFKNLP